MYLIIKVAEILPKYSHFCSLLLGWDLFRFANFVKNENISPLSNLYTRYICIIIIIIILNCDMMMSCYAVNWNNIPQDIESDLRKIVTFIMKYREWTSTKLVEYESLWVSNGQIGSSRLKNGRVWDKYASIYLVLNINIFNIEYHVIIEIVESGRVA